MTENRPTQTRSPVPPCREPSKRSSSHPTPACPRRRRSPVEGADDLYREIRIENVLKDENGQKVALKPGAHVEVTIEADPEHTTKKKRLESSDVFLRRDVACYVSRHEPRRRKLRLYRQ